MSIAQPSWYDEAEACTKAERRAECLQDIATALPVSADNIAVLEPSWR